MSFWTSSVGELTGKMEEAFAKNFVQIPDSTLALAKIGSFINEQFNGTKYLKISWILIDGEFTGQHVFQKIHAFEQDEKKRFRALNMLMLVFKMFGISPQSANPPSDQELMAFREKIAGIKIQETKPNDEGKQYNYVSEVHPAAGFQSLTGHRKIVSPVVTHSHVGVDSALSRNARKPTEDEFDDGDIPF